MNGVYIYIGERDISFRRMWNKNVVFVALQMMKYFSFVGVNEGIRRFIIGVWNKVTCIEKWKRTKNKEERME